MACRFTSVACRYPTVEHYFQASKAASFADHEYIRLQPTPREAKRAGRRIQLRADWEDVKVDVMRAGLLEKFSCEPWRSTLLRTDSRVIIEESRHDIEWGARRTSGGWHGANRLGLLLMEVRSVLRPSAVKEAPVQLTLEV
jgi:ribA/ribD-fused uncharacterized protein